MIEALIRYWKGYVQIRIEGGIMKYRSGYREIKSVSASFFHARNNSRLSHI